MAELDAQLRLDIDQALRDINQIEAALDRAIAPIEIEVDDREALQLEDTLREVERIASRASTEVASIDLAAGRAEANFEDLARALGIAEDEARVMAGQILEAQAASNRLEDSARDVARQLGLSENEARRFVDQLQRADRAADDINVTTGALVTGFGGIRTAIAGVTSALAAIGGVTILAGAIRGANTAIQSFASLEDSINAVRVLFGEGAESVLAFGETAARSAGLSELAFNQAVAPIGGLLRNFGLDAQEAARASIELVQRGADLASVYGGTVPDALLAINSALVGQVEPLRKFSAEISQSRVEAFALANGLLQAGEEMDTSVAVQARLGLILSDTNRVAGDFANTAGDLANAQRSLSGEAQNLVSDLGEALAPAFEKVLAQALPLLAFFESLIPAAAQAGDAAAQSAAGFVSLASGITLGLGGLGDIVGGAGDAGSALIALFDDLATGVAEGDASFAGINAQLDDFNQRIANQFIRTAAQSIPQAMQTGSDAFDAFANSIAFLGRQDDDLQTLQQSFSRLATVAGLSGRPLAQVTRHLIDNAAQANLNAEEVAFLRGELARLTNELDPNIEALRQQRFALSQIEAVIPPVVSAFDELGFAADTAGVSMAELVFSGDPLAEALFNALDPADQLTIKLQGVATGVITAADAFADELGPSLINVSDALIDFNENGKVSLNEFIRGLEDTLTATANFRDNMVAILAVSPDTFAALLELPQDVAAQLAEQAVSQQRIGELAAAIVGDPADLENEISAIVFEAIRLFRTQGPDVAEDFILGVPLLFEDEALGRQIVADARAGIEASRADIGNLLEAAFTQEDAMNRAAGFTVDVYDRELIRRLGQASFAQGDDIGNIIENAFAIDDINTDELLAELERQGQEARTAFMLGLNTSTGDEVGDLRRSITNTVNVAIQRSSPPKLFLDAGVDSGEAFWSGFEQSDMTLRLPTPAFSGSVQSGTKQVAGAAGGGVEVNFNLPALETRDADTVIARAGQIGGAIAGIINGRFNL